jgi:hypothetical protein
LLDDNGQVRDVDVRPVGLGQYRARIPLRDCSRLTLRLLDVEHDAVKLLHYQRPYPTEYRLQRDQDPALAALPAFEPARVRAEIPRAARRSSAVPALALAALGCLLGGVLLRRF